MKRFYRRAVLTGLAVGLAGCKGDPTASQRGTLTSLSITPRQIFIDAGKFSPVLITARDAQLNPVSVLVTVTSADAGIAAVTPDTASRPVVDSSTYAFQVAAGSPGQTKLTVKAGALTDSIIVNVLPLTFSGTLSSTTPQGGSTLTIRATPVLKFNPAHVTVTFGGDEAGTIVLATAESLKVLTPFSTPAPLTITGIVTTFITGLEITLATGATVTQTGDFWAGDASWQTAPDITALLPASGKSSNMISTTGPANVAVCPELAFASSGPCMMFKFTLADTATYKFTTDWEGTATAPDVDIYVCSDSTVANFGTACFEDGGGGATSAKPQAAANHKYTVGTHYFVIENYDGAPSKNYRTTISRP
jgi:hypothetical protein